MSNQFWIDETVYIIDNGDGTWSVTDNGEETDELDYETAMQYALEFVLTDEDIDAWHNGDGMTDHLKKIWRRFPSRNIFQIWGSRNGREPLSVVVSESI